MSIYGCQYLIILKVNVGRYGIHGLLGYFVWPSRYIPFVFSLCHLVCTELIFFWKDAVFASIGTCGLVLIDEVACGLLYFHTSWYDLKYVFGYLYIYMYTLGDLLASILSKIRLVPMVDTLPNGASKLPTCMKMVPCRFRIRVLLDLS